MTNFTISVYWTNNNWRAEIVGIRNLYAYGKTLGDALRNLAIAFELTCELEAA